MEYGKHELNNNENAAVKAVFRGKFTALSKQIRKENT